MLKSFLTVVSVALFICFANLGVQSQPSPNADQLRVADREAEWNQYAIPNSPFVRQTDPTNAVLLRVPVEWKQTQPDKLEFTGPHGTTLAVFVEKIPDGIPLRDVVAAIMQPLQSLPDNGDSLLIRRTSMSALEAREIMFESNADSVEVSRRVIWTTVSGPHALSVVLITPVLKAAEIEPYFKAVVQSVTMVDKDNQAAFDASRSTVFADSGPTRVDEVQSMAAALSALDGSSRRLQITQLASVFASSPATAIDLLLDGRPMVRAGAVEAIAQSRNNSLLKFLLSALNDREVFVAEQGARSIAANPKVVELLREQSLEWFNIESLGRVWPFLNRNNKLKILNEIFSRPVAPAVAARPVSSKVEGAGKSGVTVRATVLPPGSTPLPLDIHAVGLAPDPRRQLNALTLISDLPVSEFKLPLSQILAWKNDALTVSALQIGWKRHDLLPAADLLKLISSSSNPQVRALAALNLSQSGNNADIKTLEEYLDKPSPPANTTPKVASDKSKPIGPGDSGPALKSEIARVVSRIRLGEQLAIASGEERQKLISRGLADPNLAEWVWYRFVNKQFENVEPSAASKLQTAHPVRVLPLGENLFPSDVTQYAALPQPATAIEKLNGALGGLQLGSARAQANLVLVLSVLREQLARQLDSPPGAPPTPYSGINFDQPIAMATWVADGAPDGIESAARRAIILRVSDRARFERSLMLYQRSIGNFKELPDNISRGVRFLTLFPAILPLSAKLLLDSSSGETKEPPMFKYSFVGATEWNGHQIKVVEQREVGSSGYLTIDAAYLAYLGDTAVLTPDLDSLRDVLTRASSGRANLASNREFKRMVELQGEKAGEAIYLSNPQRVFADVSSNQDSKKDAATESGALKITNSTWENLYQIQFTESDWLKPFIGFQPESLRSPRDLLPQTTTAYYFMNFDPVAGWRDWAPQLLGAEQRKDLASVWALDFEKEVLPELGPECGVAVLGLPTLSGKWDLPWAAFFKLKSDKLAHALKDGKLLTGNASGSGPIQLKLASGEFFVAVKAGFLVVANSLTALVALDQNEKLFSSRDFSRAAKRAPDGLVAFGGYNLEASLSAIGDSGTDSIKTQTSSIVASLTNAFHSPNFYATAKADTVTARFSVSMDREGRFSVSELASLSKEFRLTFAHIEARGVPIHNQDRLSRLRIRIRSTAAGQIERIKEDVSSRYQLVEKISEKELELKVYPRRTELKESLTLPIKAAEFSPYLQPANDIRSNDPTVIERARSIAGDERDAWKVARKLADWTYKNIKWKRVDFATAPQTLATLEADCLEFSQLYVAMARSLGLPARLVHGLAYAGSAFGGHAWVEVYVGEWVEVDPTWGTDFVDATHIRNSANGALLTYASLNLIELEVLEAPGGIAEYQKNARALAAKLSEELPEGITTALTSSLDLAILTNEQLGAGTWESLSDLDRTLMTSAYRRLLLEIIQGYKNEKSDSRNWRILKVSEEGQKAEAVVLRPGLGGVLEKFRFVKRDGAWFLTEMFQIDTDLHLIAEVLRPSIRAINNRRNGKAVRGSGTSDFIRVLLVMQKDPKAAVEIADRALQGDPKLKGMRHLKAMALAQLEKYEEAIELWKALADEKEPFPPALLSLAYQSDDYADKVKQKLAIDFYSRYGKLEPEDPRSHVALARLYEANNDDVRAEAEHLAALKADPSAQDQVVDYASFLAARKRFREAVAVIDEGVRKGDAKDDLFGALMVQLYYNDHKTIVEELARLEALRLEKSARANLYLGYVLSENGRSSQAIPLFRKASSLTSEWAEPHLALARAYRNLKNWTAALNALAMAVKIDPEYSEAYLSRACALARLGRIKEALTSLEKAIELDPEVRKAVEDEADLKVLANNPKFKKLMTVEEATP